MYQNLFSSCTWIVQVQRATILCWSPLCQWRPAVTEAMDFVRVSPLWMEPELGPSITSGLEHCASSQSHRDGILCLFGSWAGVGVGIRMKDEWEIVSNWEKWQFRAGAKGWQCLAWYSLSGFSLQHQAHIKASLIPHVLGLPVCTIIHFQPAPANEGREKYFSDWQNSSKWIGNTYQPETAVCNLPGNKSFWGHYLTGNNTG